MLKNAQRIILAMIVVTMFITPFIQTDFTKFISLLAMALFFVIFPTLKTGKKTLPLVIIAAGLLVQSATKQPFSVCLEGASSMLDLVCILLVMQLFSIPIQLGTYTRDLEFLLFKYIKKEQGLFFFTTIITHFFATFLLFGTIPVMLSLLGEPLRKNVKNYKRFAATAMSRGYALMISWAPGAVMFLLVSSITKLEWNQVFLPGMLLSLIGIATSVLLESKLTLSKQNIISTQEQRNEVNEKEAWKSILDIVLVVLGMLVVIYSLEKLKAFSSTYCVMLAGVIIFSIWMIKFVKCPDIKRVLKNYWREGLLKAVDLAVVFIAIGVLTKAVEAADLVKYLCGLFGIARWGYAIIVIIPLTVILVALIGLHPMISITIIGSIFMTTQPTIPAIAIALALLLGAIISFVVAPLTGIVLTLASFLNLRTSQIALQWNGLFSVVFLVEGIILIYLWATVAA